MNEKISLILAQMAELEANLRTAVHEQESRIFFQIKGKRVEFEHSVKAAHRKLKKSFLRWLVTDRPPYAMRAADGTIVEVFEWKSEEAIAGAHGNPQVQAMWGRYAEACP